MGPSLTTSSRSEGQWVRRQRILVVLILPLAILSAVADRLARELRSACTLVRLDVQLEIDCAKWMWRGSREEGQ